MDKNTRFGDLIREIREKRGLSQRRLASDAGISPAYIARIEGGYVPPPATDKIVNIADALDISRSKLYYVATFEPKNPSKLIKKYPNILSLLQELLIIMNDSEKSITIGLFEKRIAYYREERRYIANLIREVLLAAQGVGDQDLRGGLRGLSHYWQATDREKSEWERDSEEPAEPIRPLHLLTHAIDTIEERDDNFEYELERCGYDISF